MCEILASTLHYALRPLHDDDAPALMRCYGDPNAVHCMNSDNCQGSFLVKSLPDMRNALTAWAHDDCLIRLAILSSAQNCAIGTIEYHLQSPETLILRLDLCDEHETCERIAELVDMICEEGFARYPTAQHIVTKAFPQDTSRCDALRSCGFEGEMQFHGFHHYYRKQRPYRGVAYCGLVCAYCSERTHCMGCKNASCPNHGNCKPYRCCTEKGYVTCGDCPDFPCDAPILRSLRIRTFAAYTHHHGQEALLTHLARKAAQGVQYHREQLTGDYDDFENAESLIHFLES